MDTFLKWSPVLPHFIAIVIYLFESSRVWRGDPAQGFDPPSRWQFSLIGTPLLVCFLPFSTAKTSSDLGRLPWTVGVILGALVSATVLAIVVLNVPYNDSRKPIFSRFVFGWRASWAKFITNYGILHILTVAMLSTVVVAL